MIVDFLGYIAQGLFIVASAAQARKSYIDGHSEGVSHGLIWMLTIGFGCMMIYVVQKIGFDPVLLSGYVGQALFCIIIGRYKYFPRKQNNSFTVNGEKIDLPDGLTQEQIEAAAIKSMENHGIPEELWVWDEGKAQYINVKDRK